MRRLPNVYTKGDYLYRCISRDEDIAIYSQYDKETDKLYAYEIFIVQKRKATVFKGKQIEPYEAVPSSEMWGTAAYTVSKFEEIGGFIEKLKAKINENI